MNIFLSTRRPGMQPVKAWAGVAALALGFAFASPAFAAAPPANAVIGNQASASYQDPLGATQNATSNQVITTVQQVGAFNLDTFTTTTTTVVNSKTGAAGAVVYAPHTLTNTGNGTDSFTISVAASVSPTASNSFTKVEVFADANGDGLPDSTTALCTATPILACATPAQSVAGSNGTFKFVVAYSIPAGATAATFTSPVNGTVTANVVALPLITYSNITAADVDDVNLTDVAAFNATKGLNVPAVAWVGPSTWPVASATGPRSSSASCLATVAGVTAATPGCVYTTYTLNFSNTGAAAGKFVISDILPSGLTYVASSAVWSNAPGIALGDGAGGDQTGIDFQFASGTQTVTAVVTSLPANASQTLSFVVLVNSDATIGTATTTNTAKYNPLAAPSATAAAPGATTSSTNPSAYTVTGSYSIVLGSGAGTASATTSKDASAGVPNANIEDVQTVASAAVGSTVKFPGTVFNTGNATDTVNLAVTIGTFPAGTTFSFFAADGLTPLGDSNSDGISDSGPIAAGASFKYVVAANLPPSAPLGVSATTIVKGTSINTGNPTETTRITLTTLVGVLVDLTNSAGGTNVVSGTSNDVGTGPSPSPTTTVSTPAGTGVLFDLFVKNNDTVSVTYSLAASQTSTFPGSLPAGWTVKFVAAAGTCASTAITDVTVAAGVQGNVKACVTPPLSQIPVTAQSIYFQVRSTTATSTGAIALDTKTDAVTVAAPNTFSATFTPNNSGQVAPGGSVVYAHTLTNTGGQSCVGPYNLTTVLPAADVTAGWTTALYIDVNGDGQIDAADTLVTGPITGPLATGTSQKFLLKVFAPGGATAGSIDTATVTVTFPAGAGNCGTPSAADTSTVVTGQMRVQKFQALDTACTGNITPTASAPLVAKPGECIIYRIEATNQGAAPVTNLTINDALPGYTSLPATQPASQCTSTGITGTALAYATSGSAVSCGSAANTVAPGGQAVLTFRVKVDN